MDGTRELKLARLLPVWGVFLLVTGFVGAGFALSGAAAKFDFRSFYAAGRMVRTEPAKMYDLGEQERVQDAVVGPAKDVLAFYHPAYEALLYAPFSLVGYRAAYVAFAGFDVAMLLAAFWMLRRELPGRPEWLQVRPWWLLFGFVPLLAAMVHGQDSILLLLLVTLAWSESRAGNDGLAGALLALGLFKFQIVLPVAALWALRKGWRFAAGFAAAGAGVVAVCWVVVGRAEMVAYARVLGGASSAIGTSVAAQERLSVFPLAMPNLTGVLYACGGRWVHPAKAFDALVGVAALAVLVACAAAVRRGRPETAFAVAILGGLMVSYHLYLYDLTLVVVAMMLLAERMPRWLWWVMFGVPVVLVPLGSNWFWVLGVTVGMLLVVGWRSSEWEREVTLS